MKQVLSKLPFMPELQRTYDVLTSALQITYVRTQMTCVVTPAPHDICTIIKYVHPCKCLARSLDKILTVLISGSDLNLEFSFINLFIMSHTKLVIDHLV